MSLRPPVAECPVETSCLCSNVPTDHKVSPDPTRQKARHSKWNYSEHLNQPLPTRNVRQTDATKSHCCRTTKSAPTGRPLTPWRTKNRQPQRHLHVTSNISDSARCIRAYCRCAEPSQLVISPFNRRSPAAVRPFVCGAAIMALRKPNGTLRPIASGETPAASPARSLYLISEHARGILEPLQVCVKTPPSPPHPWVRFFVLLAPFGPISKVTCLLLKSST